MALIVIWKVSCVCAGTTTSVNTTMPSALHLLALPSRLVRVSQTTLQHKVGQSVGGTTWGAARHL